MIIRVDRYLSTNDATLSRIYIDGVTECFGLEDEHRVPKVPGETRIPAGSYKVTLRTEGGFHDRYKAKFPDMHKGMLWVREVPGFEYILIHIGNTDEDTAGCLLVGQGRDELHMTVSNSKAAYEKFYPKVVDAAENGHLWINYEDNDL